MNQSCETCRYHVAFECRRHAPHTVESAMWPRVKLDDWCGEFEMSEEHLKKMKSRIEEAMQPAETPTVPPDGYRLMADDEIPTENDLEFWYGRWNPPAMTCEGGEQVGWRKNFLGAKAYARKATL